MTTNKAQVQTLRDGVWLQEPVFTHGQLYVAASRVGHPDHLALAIPTSKIKQTGNVVFKEIL